jgi:lipopolysaccharide heptosyltransferase II
MNIAVFLPNWIGDVVMATPAVRAVRRHFEQAHIVGVCRSYVEGVIRGAPWFDSLLHLNVSGPWSKRWLAVAWRLRRAKVDLAILFPNSFHAALVAWLGGCQQRVGYRRYARGWLLSDAIEPKRDARGHITPSPVIDAYNALVQEVGCPAPGHVMELFTTGDDEQAADRVWEQCRLHEYPEVVCLNPGAAFGASKNWPVDHFARLAQDLADRRGAGVLVLCGPAERDMARQIAASAARPAVHSLADQPLSLGLTKACVRRAHLLVTTDSGPRHFAAAFNRPVVTLFGPTHIAWTETYFRKAVHLQKKVECGPCQLRVCPLDHRCMTSLTATEVYEAAEDLLARFPASVQRKAS